MKRSWYQDQMTRADVYMASSREYGDTSVFAHIMFCKVLVVWAGMMALCASQHTHTVHPQVRVEDYDSNPQYSFTYQVQDSHTGDYKSHHETRQGDLVQGSYVVDEPDGSRRTVQYTADSHSGFNAVVHREAGVHPGYRAITPVALVAAVPIARTVLQYPAARATTQAPYHSATAPYTASYQQQQH